MSDVFEFFLHNWAQSVSMETEWQTDVETSAEDLIESRRALLSKPRRTLSVQWHSVTRGETHRLFMSLARVGHNSYLNVPLYQDVALTTAPSSGTTIHVPTTDRRFTDDDRHYVIFQVVGGRPSNVQYFDVAPGGSTDTTLTAGVALTGTYPTGSIVMATMACEPSLSAEMDASTDKVATFAHAFVERLTWAFPSIADYADIEPDYWFGYTNDSRPFYIFDTESASWGPNWSKAVGLVMSRSGNEVELGRDHVTFLRGPRPQFGFRFTCDRANREDAFALLRFFDAHRGRLVPFFVPNPLTIWTVTNLSTSWVEVALPGGPDDVAEVDDFLTFLFLRDTSDEFHVREITTATIVGGALRIGVSPALPLMVASDIVRATSAHLCRFRSDALREEWHSSSVVSFGFDVVEILGNEEEVSL